MRSTIINALIASAAATGAATLSAGQSLEPDRAALEFHRTTLHDGEIDPLRSPLIEAIDGIAGGVAPRRATTTRSLDPTLGNPNPWADLIEGNGFHVGFEEATPHTTLADPSGFVPLAGQTTPEGFTWGAAADYNGVVDNADAQTGPNWNPSGTGFDRHGVLGGPDPNGDRGQFFASPRGTIEPQAFLDGNFFVGRLRHELFLQTHENSALTIVSDVYLDDIDTFVWMRPVSFFEGFIVTNVFMGGFQFTDFAPFTNDDDIADRMIVLGLNPGGLETEFFVAPEPHRIVERQWFQVAVRTTNNSLSVWVRDSTTIGVHGFEQDSSFDGFPGDDARGAFAGEILSQDWLQVFPGVADDPDTAVVEGLGRAANEFNQLAPVRLDATGSPAGELLAARTVDAIQIITGSDPIAEVPGFQPHDWYFDNYTVFGDSFDFPVHPPLQLPFFEDFEQLQEGPIIIYDGNILSTEDDNHTSLLSGQNHTPGGEKSIRHILGASDSIPRTFLRRDTLATQARPGEPVETSFWTLFENQQARAARAVRAGDAFHLVLGALGADGAADDRVYARLPNPNFDPGQPEDLLPGAFDQHTSGANTPFVNVPLVDGAGQPITTPLNAWFQTRTIVDASGALRVFVGGVEAFADGSVEGISELTAPGDGFDSLEFLAAFEPAGFSSRMWIDDIAVDAKPRLRPDVLNAAQPPFDDDPPFALPYIDGLETYGVGGSLNQQGATPWLESLFTRVGGQVDILPLAPEQTVDEQTTGFFYAIDEVLYGEAPGGVGDRVFIVDNIPPTLPPDAAPVPGEPFSTTPTLGVFRSDAEFPRALGQVEWRLQNAAPEPWDGVAPVLGRFWAGFEERWATVAGQDQLVADPTGENRGAVLSLHNTFVSSDAGTGDLDGLVSSLFPQARTDTMVTLAFDLWVGVDDPAAGPRGRLAWDINGPGAQPGQIARAVFGGPNNYLDELTLDPATGEILSEPDGLPDNFLRGQPRTVGGDDTLDADPTRLYIARLNPFFGDIGSPPGTPRLILEQTDYTVPGNAWIRCTAEITGQGDWTLSFDDGSTTFVVSGEAIDAAAGDARGTDSLNLSTGFDPGADGFAPTDPIAFTPLAPDAAPEGGLAPLDNPATVNGDFNDYIDPEYFYFEIREIFATGSNAGARPMIREVDAVNGTLLPLREIEPGDVVVLWNDQSTQAFGGPAGQRFSDTIARHPEFMITEDGTTVTVRGEWTPLGLPGEAGIEDPAPNGGVANTAPPYNNSVPFRTILMGSVADFPPLVGEPLPGRAEWLVDNVRLDAAPPCVGNLITSAPEAVDTADLGALLGSWGLGDPDADLNADGVVDGADLGMLLGVWGPCP